MWLVFIYFLCVLYIYHVVFEFTRLYLKAKLKFGMSILSLGYFGLF